jgi:probable HAF family extracellular repeat protein
MRTTIDFPKYDSQFCQRLRTRAGIHFLVRAAVPAAALALTAACSDTSTAPLAAPPTPTASLATAQPSRYTIAEIGTFGGSFSIAFNINNGGGVSGAATTANGYQHAFFWDQGQMTDLGTLGGLNSQAAGGNPGQVIAVLSETAEIDPLGENFCGFFTDLVCGAAIWQHGTMTRLPTLGGINAAALTYNAGGQIVGVSDDGTLDPSCIAPQKSHFQAVTWTPKGVIQKLPPLPGDNVGVAIRGNDHGQVAGTSGLCSNTRFGGFAFGPHAVLWDHGSPINLGSLGGSGVGLAAGVNNRGQVIGAASSSDGTPHPFLWTSATGMRDLGLLSMDPADAGNTPFEINDRGQMVGASCDITLATCRGYIWQNGIMTDINDLLPADSPLYVILPLTINESGQIAGLAVVKSTGDVHAFVATPARGGAATVGATAGHSAAHRMLLPENARKTIQRMLGRHGHNGPA